MIIVETKTSRFKLQEIVKKSEDKLKDGGNSLGLPSSSGGTGTQSSSTAASARVVQLEESVPKEEEQEGTIYTVYPKTDKVFVKVLSHRGDGDQPIFFNQINDKDESIESLLAIPLEDFDPKTGESLDSLIDRRVKVTVTKEGLAIKAKLITATVGDSVLDVSIPPHHIKSAYEHPEGVRVGLEKLGYPKEALDDMFTMGLELEDSPNEGKGVIRIKGEGYWDQAIEESTERTIRVVNAIEAWKEKNLSPMKTKLCHNPIIAFSAR